MLLGAGYDTTSLRLGLGGATLFEVDASANSASQARDHPAPRPAGSAVRYVQCDFEGDTLSERLCNNGFDGHAPSLIAWWGVSFYLTEHAIHRTISEVASMTAPGSRFMFDYLDPGVVDGTTVFPGARRGRAAVARRGESYTFGLKRDQAGQLLNSFGFEVETNLSITELAQLYNGFAYRADDFCSVITGKRVTR